MYIIILKYKLVRYIFYIAVIVMTNEFQFVRYFFNTGQPTVLNYLQYLNYIT